MNISFIANNLYSSQYMKNAQGNLYAQKTDGAMKNTVMGKMTVNPFVSSFDRRTDNEVNDRKGLSQQMRQMIRSLKQDSQQDQNNKKINDFLTSSGSPDAAEEETAPKPTYNYKEVASKIQSAKTSNSAGQAVLAAKRAVTQIKRKISAGDGDPEELQFALTHAKRMEMVARKKKHHLELEEMVARAQKQDERLDEQEDAVRGIQSAITQAEEEKITEKEDQIFDEREEMLEEVTIREADLRCDDRNAAEQSEGAVQLQGVTIREADLRCDDRNAAEQSEGAVQLQDVLSQIEESGANVSDEMMADLNKMISEFGEKELEELEETMEMLEDMEVVDPHMSKEDFEDLKRKHRASENKAIVKANMEYLKDMIKHELGKAGSIPGMGGGQSASAVQGVTVSMPAMAAPVSDGGSIDVQI
ncbi:hypothetical protein [Butyrivibrio sp. WCE2006]|uniref:hypothetical protein n=1 Tax=Butyrivibrio sp. WCE2006 TaxID=1410611 RepID=UPI0005D240CF|nr:hypothetical protein [Butyrivibrio sp. WCE2006]